MEMSLMNAGLAAGAALAALPVILHLFMRQTPKHIMFPAMRLLRERSAGRGSGCGSRTGCSPGADGGTGLDGAGAGTAPAVLAGAAGDESVPTALGLVFDTACR